LRVWRNTQTHQAVKKQLKEEKSQEPHAVETKYSSRTAQKDQGSHLKPHFISLMLTPCFFENGFGRSHLSPEGKRSFQVVPHGGAWRTSHWPEEEMRPLSASRPNKANKGAIRTSREECCQWISAYVELSDIPVRNYLG